MSSGRAHFKRGVFWIGLASLITRLLDIASYVVILVFLSPEELGLATLAWSVAVILESFNGLGLGTALVQAPSVDRRQWDSAYWFTVGLAFILVASISAASPFIASYYGSDILQPMIMVSALKLLFVGMALVPLQSLNRALKFKEIGFVETFATFLSSVIKILLAWQGFGAWALVMAHTGHGFFMMVGANIFHPFLPKLRFSLNAIRPMIIFGMKVATSGIIFHFYRNADFLLVGKFLGNEILGVYRVARDVAMTLAETVLKIVNRVSFPVFSRLADKVEELKEIFLWMQRNLALLLVPIVVILTFGSVDLMTLIGKEDWIAAAPAIQVLSWVAMLRGLAQMMPQLFHATGKPEYAIYDSLISLVVLMLTFTTFLAIWGDTLGVLSVCYAWLFSYPILIAFLLYFSRKVIPLSYQTYLSTFRHPLIVAVVCVIAVIPILIIRDQFSYSWLRFGLVFATVSGTFWAYLHFVLKIDFKRLIGPEEKHKSRNSTASV